MVVGVKYGFSERKFLFVASEFNAFVEGRPHYFARFKRFTEVRHVGTGATKWLVGVAVGFTTGVEVPLGSVHDPRNLVFEACEGFDDGAVVESRTNTAAAASSMTRGTVLGINLATFIQNAIFARRSFEGPDVHDEPYG